MESHSVELETSSLLSKVAVPGDAEKHNSSVNGDDSLSTNSLIMDSDKVNADISSEFIKESAKNDLSNCSLSVANVNDSIQGKQTSLCSDNNNRGDISDSINRLDDDNCNVSSSVCVNNSSSGTFNNLDHVDEQSRKSLNDSDEICNKDDDSDNHVSQSINADKLPSTNVQKSLNISEEISEMAEDDKNVAQNITDDERNSLNTSDEIPNKDDNHVSQSINADKLPSTNVQKSLNISEEISEMAEGDKNVTQNITDDERNSLNTSDEIPNKDDNDVSQSINADELPTTDVQKSSNIGEKISKLAENDDNLALNITDYKLMDVDETVVDNIKDKNEEESNKNINNVKQATSMANTEQVLQDTSVTSENDEVNININDNSCLSEGLPVAESNVNVSLEKDSSKDIYDNSNASTSVSKDQEDSNPPLGMDETSMNLSETGAGSGNEFERTEQTRFLECDDVPECEDVMDVIEVNAVDPFAQTIDSERNDTLMDVDDNTNELNNQNTSNEDVDITQGTVKEMDVTKITDKKDKTEETNQGEMETEESVEGSAKDIDQIRGDDTGVKEVHDKKTDETETTEQEMDITSVSEKEMDQSKTVEQDMDMTEIPHESSANSDKDLDDTNEKDAGNQSSKKINGSLKVSEEETKVDEKIQHQSDTAVVDSLENESIPTEKIIDKEKTENSSTEQKQDKEITENSSVECSRALKASTVVENDDEDVCIIPDTVPRMPTDPEVISNIGSKLKNILSKTNIIESQKTEAVPSRPQRQAAKKAGAQIKATVHELEDEDGEKENDDDVDAEIDDEDEDDEDDIENRVTATPPTQQQNIQVCQQCCKPKVCRYKILSQGKTLSYLCSEACTAKYRESLNEHIRLARAKKKEAKKVEAEKEQQIKLVGDGVPSVDTTNKGSVSESKQTTVAATNSAATAHLFRHALDKTAEPPKRPLTRRLDENGEFIRACSECGSTILVDERNLSWETMDFCNELCLGKYQTSLGSFCAYCKKSVQQSSLGKYCVRFGYDIRQFCCASCLEEFKKGLKVCSYCQKDISSSVEGFLAPVGDKGQFKDFCTQSCMEKYEQMSTNQRPPPQMYPCDVCKNNKLVQVEVLMDTKISKLCSEVCFAAFKFVNTIKVDQCDMCHKYFDRANFSTENFTVYYEESQHNFCCKTCMNVYILAKRKIVPCNWCKVKKYNFDMIKRVTSDSQGAKQSLMMCSLNCLTLYQVSVNAVSTRRIKCDSCSSVAQAQYHLTMSDATIRNFCNYNCVMKFQAQYNKSPITLPPGQTAPPIPTGIPKRVVPAPPGAVSVSVGSTVSTAGVPIISSVQSLAAASVAPTEGGASVKQVNSLPSVQVSAVAAGAVGSSPVPVSLQTAATASGPSGLPSVLPVSPPTTATQSPIHVIVKHTQPVQMANRMTQVRSVMHTKGVSCRPHACAKQSQTDNTNYVDDGKKVLIPVPVPIYIPLPMHMYTLPSPVPFPIPVPVPVPIFIPTTRGSAKGILKEIKKIQEKIPTDPFEAELLMMAEMVAEQKKQEETSDSDDQSRDADAGPSAADAEDTSNGAEGPVNTGTSIGEVMEASSNAFGADDMLQMALKMATELDDQSNGSPTVDLEAELPPNTITPAPPQPRELSSRASSRSNHTDGDENEEDVDDPEPIIRESRGRKRAGRPPGSTNRRSSSGGTPTVAKRARKSSSAGRNVANVPAADATPPPVVPIPVEKPDANMCLKYTFGVNAWKQWVTAKNAELEKQSTTSSGNNNNRKVKLFKTDLLQLTADELNYSLCLFVKEARKPNGTTYAPDTIYYFCLGIQQYLFENGRIDNIFTDSYYEKFTECLNEVAKVFSDVSDDTKLIVTRVEEEHLWESKQLGAHSPHVLLSTLMFFNTKHFNLTSVDEHMQLSFSHIMKHWKRNPSTPGSTPAKSGPGSRNVLLRFYPPQSAIDAPNSKKKKVYEQQENEENPLRCPVKLYEFYLSKCPESVKTRNDVFYLLPERSCVPDSPVWYSTMALGKEPLLKMLHRVKMVKEINIALRSS